MDFPDAKALVAGDDFLFRKRLSHQLRAVGFADVADVDHVAAFDAALLEQRFDLILATPRLAAQPLLSTLSRLRDGSLPHHPFPIVVIVMQESDRDLLSKIVNCGPDDIAVMPIDPPHLVERIAAHVAHRKPFVVTSDFVGPDRRKDPRPGEVAPTLVPPNPLLARGQKTDLAMLDADLQAATEQLRIMKIERAIYEIGWLNRSLARLMADPAKDPDKVILHFRRLGHVAQLLPARFPGSAWAPIAPDHGRFSAALSALTPDANDLQPLSAASAALVAALQHHLTDG